MYPINFCSGAPTLQNKFHFGPSYHPLACSYSKHLGAQRVWIVVFILLRPRRLTTNAFIKRAEDQLFSPCTVGSVHYAWLIKKKK